MTHTGTVTLEESEVGTILAGVVERKWPAPDGHKWTCTPTSYKLGFDVCLEEIEPIAKEEKGNE
jgi:hypothetical protein